MLRTAAALPSLLSTASAFPFARVCAAVARWREMRDHCGERGPRRVTFLHCRGNERGCAAYAEGGALWRGGGVFSPYPCRCLLGSACWLEDRRAAARRRLGRGRSGACQVFCAPGFRAAGVAGGANETLHAFPSESVRVHLRLCLHPSVLVSTSDSCCMCACRSRACTRRDSS